MKPYKSKNVEVSAVQLTAYNYSEISNWIAAKGYEIKYLTKPPMRKVSGITIELPDNPLKAYFGDYIVLGLFEDFRVFSEGHFKLFYEEI